MAGMGQAVETVQGVNEMFDFLIARLKEPSTWAGIAALLGAAGFTFSEELGAALTTAGVAVAGLIAVFMAERNKGE